MFYFSIFNSFPSLKHHESNMYTYANTQTYAYTHTYIQTSVQTKEKRNTLHHTHIYVKTHGRNLDDEVYAVLIKSFSNIFNFG